MDSIKAAYKHTKVGTFLFKVCAKWTEFMLRHRWLYYFLSCTWGIIMTIVGLLISGVLAVVKLVSGNRVKISFTPYNWVYGISVGSDYWGGFECGLCFLQCQKAPNTTRAHEFGHTFQNCLFGPLFIFLVALPSITWYWMHRLSKKPLKPYDSLWFEDAATQCGIYADLCLYAEKHFGNEEKENG